jgi:hypothetical protein
MLLSHYVFFGVLHQKERSARCSLCVSVTSAAVEIGFISLRLHPAAAAAES